MKTKTLLPLLLAAISIWGCKKETDLLSARDWVVGAWKPALRGYDNNNNFSWDPEEKHRLDDSEVVTFQFKGGGVGYRIGPNHAYVDTLEWSLVNNERVLKLTINDKGFIQYLYYPVQMSYTAQTLTLTDTSKTPYFFTQYNREN